jgi:glucokinase
MSTKFYTIGIDVGGTKMSGILFDGKKVLADFTLATPKDNLEHFLIMIYALINPLIEKAKADKVKISGMGIGVPGVLNKERNKILRCRNVPILNDVELVKKLNEKFDFPIILDNDAKCFLRAEAMLGAGQKFKNIFGMIIGTGIGGGWWFENKIYAGTYHSGGEPGRIIINFQEPIDLESAYHKLTQNNPSKLAQEAYRGDILAEKAFEELGRFLGLAFVNIVNLIDPEAIIIGGGVAESSDLFLKEAQKTLQEYVKSSEAKKVKIIKGKLGAQAGGIGAALLIKQHVI